MTVDNKSWYNPTPDEQVIWDDNPSFLVYAPKILAGLTLGVIGLIGVLYIVFMHTGKSYYTEYMLLGSSVVSFIFAAYVYLQVKNTYYVITNQRVIRKEGIIGTRKSAKKHANIVRIDLNITPLKNMLNTVTSLDIGDVTIRSADDRAQIFKLGNLKSTTKVERLLDDLSNSDTNVAAKHGTDAPSLAEGESDQTSASGSSTRDSQPNNTTSYENPEPDTGTSDSEFDEFEPSNKA